jgi:hypothetical protein
MVTLGLIGIAISTITACTTPPSAPHTSTDTTTSSASATPPTTTRSGSAADVAAQRAIAAYLGMWQDFSQAGTTSDWQSPALAQHATGIALSTMSRGLYADHYNDLVTKGTATHDPHVTSSEPFADPMTVVITDCSDSTHYVKYSAKTGQSANDGSGGRQLITAIVQRQVDGSWKVSDFGVHGVGTC